MMFFFVECYFNGKCVERSHLYRDLEYCIKLAEEKIKMGYDWTSVERMFYDDMQDECKGDSLYI